MSSSGKKSRRGFFTKKSSNSVDGLDASGEKASPEHDAVDTGPTPKVDQVPPVGFTELFR